MRVVTKHAAQDQRVRGRRVRPKAIPAVTDVWWPHVLHCQISQRDKHYAAYPDKVLAANDLGGDKMLIDTHVHVWTFPSLQNLQDKIKTKEDLAGFRTRHPEFFKAAQTETPVDNSQDLITALDRAGVDIALVQSWPGRITNDMVAESVARHRGRLYGLVQLTNYETLMGYPEDPTSKRAQAAAEVRRGIEELGMIGVGEMTIRAFTRELHPEKIADDLKPIMDAVKEYGVPVQIPTAWTQFAGQLYYGNPEWVDEIAARYPNVPIILTKMGRALDFYFEMSLTVAMRNDNVYFDIVGTNPKHLRQAVYAIGAHRILYGSDWSATWRWLSDPADVHTEHLRLLRDAGLSQLQQEQIRWTNAAQLYRLKV